MVDASSALRPSLCADQFQLAESGRALVRRVDQQENPSRVVRQREDLEQAVEQFLAVWNEKPKPFVWTATVESIVEKLSRCRQTLEKIQPGCTLPRKRRAKN